MRPKCLGRWQVTGCKGRAVSWVHTSADTNTQSLPMFLFLWDVLKSFLLGLISSSVKSICIHNKKAKTPPRRRRCHLFIGTGKASSDHTAPGSTFHGRHSCILWPHHDSEQQVSTCQLTHKKTTIPAERTAPDPRYPSRLRRALAHADSPIQNPLGPKEFPLHWWRF